MDREPYGIGASIEYMYAPKESVIWQFGQHGAGAIRYDRYLYMNSESHAVEELFYKQAGYLDENGEYFASTDDWVDENLSVWCYYDGQEVSEEDYQAKIQAYNLNWDGSWERLRGEQSAMEIMEKLCTWQDAFKKID